MTTPETAPPRRAKYVIVSDCDRPEPRMVCQWVPNVGYCYLDRSDNKARFDGMRGTEATPIEAFGFVWTENSNGTVRFSQTDEPATATYRDGEPRRWQSRITTFEFRQLKRRAVVE